MTQELNHPIKSLHFVGIGGSGMCPLAIIAKSKGYMVTGSDLSNGRNVSILKDHGIEVSPNHLKENMLHADAIVVSSAIKPENPEVLEAKRKNLPVLHRSYLLAKFSASHHLITVAGTHGKTTTSAILSYLLEVIEEDPMAVVGGHMLHFDASWHIGEGKYFVAEADESDGSFLGYSPNTAILNNIDKDHLDYYGGFDGIKSAFEQYLSNIKKGGTAIVGTNDPNSHKVYSNYTGKKLSFGTSEFNDLYATDLTVEGQYVKFKLYIQDRHFDCKLKSIGPHNVANALAALAALYSLGLPMQPAIKALSNFPGVARRLSIIYDKPSIKVIDDYAHNPGKIEASIEAVRAAFSNHDVFVIFEPHRFSRLDTMYNEFIHSFTKASQVYVTPIFSAGEVPNDQYNPQIIAEDINRASCVDSYSYDNEEQVLGSRDRRNPNKIVVLTVGAGESSKIAFAMKRYAIATQETTFSKRATAKSEA